MNASYCMLHEALVNKKPISCAGTFQLKTCRICSSLACPMSANFTPVEKWKCYQKKYENKKIRST